MEHQDNITFRRAVTQLTINKSESDMSIDTLDVTTSSLPDISVENNEQVKNLIQKIEQLQIQLNSAHGEIEQLSLVNRDLKRNNQELMTKNALYKKIGSSPSKFISPTLSTPRKNATLKPNYSVPKQTHTTKIKEVENKTIDILNKETQTYTELHEKKPDKIDNETQTNILWPQRIRSEEEEHRATYQITNIAKNYHDTTEHHQSAAYKPKLCVISNNKHNKVLSIAQDMTGSSFQVCHYLTPNGCTQQLLKGLQAKLTNFTTDDYCIILIGDQDFQESNNNLELINYIR